MVLKSAVGANPTLLYQSLIASRHSLPFFFRLANLPTCRLANKFRLGRSLALPFFASSLVPRPTTRFKSVAMKMKPAEAGKLEKSKAVYHSLLAVRHSLSFWALACFELVATYLGWVVKAVSRSPLAIRYSLPFYQSLIASRRSRSLFAIRHSLLAAVLLLFPFRIGREAAP
jgi:hypothetical protein